jgi:hypothetical protein
MDSISAAARRVLDIEARQDEALRQLDLLERELERVLAEHLPAPAASPALHGVSAERTA